jgi:hypothetical protein
MPHDLVRPFVMTGGRTRAEGRELRMETMLRTVAEPEAGTLPSEQLAMVQLCREPQSIAEVAARLNLVLGVAAIIAGDLINQGLFEVHHTDPVDIELDALTRMIERVRAI